MTRRARAWGFPRILSFLPAFFALIACGERLRVAGPEDRALYLRALSAKSGDENARFALCDDIRDPQTRGDCALAVAVEGARRAREAIQDRCPRVPRGIWRSECYFMAAEHARRQGQPSVAARLCAEAIDFHDDCGQHLWQTSVRELVAGPGPQAFRDTLPEARHLYDAWHPLLAGETDFEERFWRRFYQNAFEPREAIDLGACDVLDPADRDRCRASAADLYGRRVLMALKPPGMSEAFCAHVKDQASAIETLGTLGKLGATADPLFDQTVFALREGRCPS
jgi:hypothetical protein